MKTSLASDKRMEMDCQQKCEGVKGSSTLNTPTRWYRQPERSYNGIWTGYRSFQGENKNTLRKESERALHETALSRRKGQDQPCRDGDYPEKMSGGTRKKDRKAKDDATLSRKYRFSHSV